MWPQNSLIAQYSQDLNSLNIIIDLRNAGVEGCAKDEKRLVLCLMNHANEYRFDLGKELLQAS